MLTQSSNHTLSAIVSFVFYLGNPTYYLLHEMEFGILLLCVIRYTARNCPNTGYHHSYITIAITKVHGFVVSWPYVMKIFVIFLAKWFWNRASSWFTSLHAVSAFGTRGLQLKLISSHALRYVALLYSVGLIIPCLKLLLSTFNICW